MARAMGGALLARRPAPVCGDLPLATSSVPGECVLPAWLSGFHHEFPGVHVRATIGDTPRR